MIDFPALLVLCYSAKFAIVGKTGDTIEINYTLDGIPKQRSFIYSDEKVFYFSEFGDSSKGEMKTRAPIIEIPQAAKSILLKFRNTFADSIALGDTVGCLRITNASGIINLAPFDQSSNSGPKENVERKFVQLKKPWIKSKPQKSINLRNDSIRITIRVSQVDTTDYFINDFIMSIKNKEIPKESPLFSYSRKPINLRACENLLAKILMNGECEIVDLRSNKTYNRIMIEEFSSYCGPLCGWKGRRFYVGEMLLLAVLDEIS